MKRNKLLTKLRNGECVIIPEVGHFASYKLLEMMGLIGFDGVWIDMEHKDFGLEHLGTLTLSCRVTGIESVVRIAKGGYVDLIRPLETGATGIVVPHCMNETEAREIVRDTRFSPIGCRGFDGVGPDARYRTVSIEDYRKWANEEVLLVVMIEDREAVEEVDAIASVPGIDVLYIGPADLRQSYGHFLEFEHILIKKTIDKVASFSGLSGQYIIKFHGQTRKFLLMHGDDIELWFEKETTDFITEYDEWSEKRLNL